MYPNLFYAFKDLFGIEIPFFKIINTAGFFAALGILTSVYFWVSGVKTKQENGEIIPLEKTVKIGKSASAGQLLLSFIIGFLSGYKLFALLFVNEAQNNILSFLLSTKGSLPAGLICGFLAVLIVLWKKKRQKFKEPIEKTTLIWPADVITGAAILGIVSGMIGSKLFDILDNWSSFIQNPINTIFSVRGWTIYGAFIVGTITLWFAYSFWGKYRMRMTDPIAPALMIGYAVGRLGCHLSGDGDWGIVNNNSKPINWLPEWLWAYHYPHNVIKRGIYMSGCDWGDYCYRLAAPVYPTSLYETIISLIFFAILWSVRKKIKIAGRLSALYLILNGVERFIIEPLRVNIRHNFLGLHVTQAQLIASLFILAGLLLYILSPKLTINKDAYESENKNSVLQ